MARGVRPHRVACRGGARPCPRPRCRAPRRQTLEHHVDPGRPRPAARLRIGACGGRRVDDARRDPARVASLHGARAGPRRSGRRSYRRVRTRRHALRDGRPRVAVLGREQRRPAAEDPRCTTDRVATAEPRRRPRPGDRVLEGHRPGPLTALRDGGCVRRRSAATSRQATDHGATCGTGVAAPPPVPTPPRGGGRDRRHGPPPDRRSRGHQPRRRGRARPRNPARLRRADHRRRQRAACPQRFCGTSEPRELSSRPARFRMATPAAEVTTECAPLARPGGVARGTALRRRRRRRRSPARRGSRAPDTVRRSGLVTRHAVARHRRPATTATRRRRSARLPRAPVRRNRRHRARRDRRTDGGALRLDRGLG